ncbi:NADH ubiquinone oxidoreductase subunit NDUFA12-domain-containing protein [Gorgonomyces haynaldii]|nr:NADH ubiquinone oxidoreductase subunit NDUFA12-domain-containing protein [Gorgonomyces haynaldii]
MSTWKNYVFATLDSVRAKGLKKTFKEIVTLDQPRTGALIGVDVHGNEYYENRKDISNRDRWVIYNKWDYDGSQVPPQWHQWLHKISDDVPTDKTVPTPFYEPAHFENMTGTRGAFKTYNTVAQKLHQWEPKVKERQ